MVYYKGMSSVSFKKAPYFSITKLLSGAVRNILLFNCLIELWLPYRFDDYKEKKNAYQRSSFYNQYSRRGKGIQNPEKDTARETMKERDWQALARENYSEFKAIMKFTLHNEQRRVFFTRWQDMTTLTSTPIKKKGMTRELICRTGNRKKPH